MYRRERSLNLRENLSLPQRRRTPSFSSSLLDAIYRSIDHESHNGDADAEQDLSFYCEKTIIKNKRHRNYSVKPVEEANNIRRAIMIEDWMEKQSSLRSSCLHFNNSTSTTSSDSSSGVGAVFSSSEAESNNYKDRSRRSKPLRSMKCLQFEKRISEENYHQSKPKSKPNPNREGGVSKTKLKALKIYRELKKVKHPISPGGRITSFLNSIFSSGNGKKVNVCTVKAMEDVNFDSQSKSGFSSATSFSRSCLSKTPPSSCRGKHVSSGSSKNNGGNGMKRSVRFYPVSVIVDENCKPCGHKRIYEDDPTLLSSQNIKTNNCSLKLEELIKKKETGVSTLLTRSTYPKKGLREFVSRGTFTAEDKDEDEDDAWSYSSSDLFELDHLKGIERYREELPVYETTNLKKNQAIANRFIL